MPNFATISGNILADSGISNTLGSSGISGATGTAGVSGSSGISATGTSGTSAISGSSGTSGTAGTTVANGSSGTSGLSSVSGTSGSSGTNGTSGSSGSGSSGTSGSNGTSVSGSSFSGASGISGYFPLINGSTGMSYTNKMYQFDNGGTTCINITGSADASTLSPFTDIALAFGNGNTVLTQLYNPYAYNNSGGSADLFIDATGLIGQAASSLKYKTNVETLEDISWLNQLRPVSYNYRKKDENDNFTDEAYDDLWYGFIAEEVEKVNPDLVSYDILEDGTKRVATIYYQELLAPMYKKVQELDKRLKTLELK